MVAEGTARRSQEHHKFARGAQKNLARRLLHGLSRWRPGRHLVICGSILGASWESLGGLLGVSWDPLRGVVGASWGFLGPLGGLLGTSREPLGDLSGGRFRAFADQRTIRGRWNDGVAPKPVWRATESDATFCEPS